MKINKTQIISEILHTNKNRKNIKIKVKNRTKIIKIEQKHLKICVLNTQLAFLLKKTVDLFPMQNINKNKQNLIDISNYLSQKINSQILYFRSVKGCIIIDHIAKTCVFSIVKSCSNSQGFDLNNLINFNGFYKKEKNMLPILLLSYYIKVLTKIIEKLSWINQEIRRGAVQKRFSFINKYTRARAYGIYKYNQNLLKLTNISLLQIKKCVFNFINKLTNYHKKIVFIFKQINLLLTYCNKTNFQLFV